MGQSDISVHTVRCAARRRGRGLFPALPSVKAAICDDCTLTFCCEGIQVLIEEDRYFWVRRFAQQFAFLTIFANQHDRSVVLVSIYRCLIDQIDCGAVFQRCFNHQWPIIEELDQDFLRLMNLLTVKPEVENLLLEIAIQADNGRQGHEQRDFEQEKTEALALCYRRIDAAVTLFKEGTIDKAEYLRLREQNEREIAHWESRTSDTEKLGLEFALCIEAVDKIHRLWTISSDEDRQGLVRNLFSSVTYDLDRRRITDFRLKPWAGRFLTVRAGLHELEQAAKNKEDAPEQDRQGACTKLLHTGLEPVFWP